ncbi:MAG: rod shape-determining protein MreC [Candidatus Nomurabacteria bacterium]|nr:rod shape-determining protein MreC [Candidatus Nomurabacteria bacterium]USN87971.1 MAG: rod shape-determining protein MreC [Candidatus Nomurabacteria bacterium]
MKKYSSTTKVNYRHISHKKRRTWILVAAALIFIGWLLPWLTSQVASVALYPFHVVTVWVKNSNGVFPTYLRSKAELVTELEELRAKDATETGTQLTIQRLLMENMQLRKLANVDTPNQRIVARVIAQPSTLVYDSLQIDQGSEAGLEVGMPVYSGLDSVLGIVSHVTPKYSFVELFTTSGFEATAYIIGPNVFADIQGVGGGVARVSLPQGVPMTVGNEVLLPALTSGVYGEIAWVENHPTQPEQYGYVVPPVAMNSIFYVSIDTNVVQPKTEVEIVDNIEEEIEQKLKLNRELTDSLTDVLATQDIAVLEVASSSASTTVSD